MTLFQDAKTIMYLSVINKPRRPSLWSKLTRFFHRKKPKKKLDKFNEYLLSTDQLAHSSEQEYYERVEDEE